MNAERHSISRHTSVDSQLIFNQCLSVGWYSANCRRTVNQVSIKGWLSINQNVDQVPIEMLIDGMDHHLTMDALSTHEHVPSWLEYQKAIFKKELIKRN